MLKKAVEWGAPRQDVQLAAAVSEAGKLHLQAPCRLLRKAVEAEYMGPHARTVQNPPGQLLLREFDDGIVVRHREDSSFAEGASLTEPSVFNDGGARAVSLAIRRRRASRRAEWEIAGRIPAAPSTRTDSPDGVELDVNSADAASHPAGSVRSSGPCVAQRRHSWCPTPVRSTLIEVFGELQPGDQIAARGTDELKAGGIVLAEQTKRA